MVEVSKSPCGWLDQPKLMRRPKSGGCVATKMVEETKFLSGCSQQNGWGGTKAWPEVLAKRIWVAVLTKMVDVAKCLYGCTHQNGWGSQRSVWLDLPKWLGWRSLDGCVPTKMVEMAKGLVVSFAGGPLAPHACENWAWKWQGKYLIPPPPSPPARPTAEPGGCCPRNFYVLYSWIDLYFGTPSPFKSYVFPPFVYIWPFYFPFCLYLITLFLVILPFL
jgi:hypothetical protein